MNDENRIRKAQLGVALVALTGLAARIAVIEIDRDFLIPLANDDAARFQDAAVEASSSLTDIFDLMVRGGAFVYVASVSFIYWLTGVTSPELAKIANTAASVVTLFVTLRTVKYLDHQSRMRARLILVVLWATFPSIVVFSALMLRESYVSLTIAIWLLAVVRSHDSRSPAEEQRYLVIAAIAALCGAILHVATAVFLIYPALRLLKTANLGLSRLFLLALGTSLVLATAPLWAPKILISAGIDSLGDLTASSVLETSERFRRGGSAYTVPLSTNPNPVVQLFSTVFIAPIFFLATPFPWQVRSAFDLAAGATGWLTLYAFAYSAIRLRREQLFRVLVIPLLLFTLAFAAGTSNSGTAFRHRTKAWSVLAVTYVLASSRSSTQSRSLDATVIRTEPDGQRRDKEVTIRLHKPLPN